MKTLCFTLCGLLVPVVAAAQALPAPAAMAAPAEVTALGAPRKTGLPELEELALANHPSLCRAAARVDAARGEWQQVGLYPNPVGGYVGTEMGDENTAGKQGGFLSQEIVSGGKLRLNRAVAEQQIALAEAQFAAQRQLVLNDVRTAFFDALVAQRLVEITAQLLDLGTQGLAAAEKLERAQQVSRIDVLQSRVELNGTKLALANAHNRQQSAWQRLAAVVGLPEMRFAGLEGDLEAGEATLEFENALNRLLTESPEIAEVQAELQRAQWAVDRAYAETSPNLTLQAEVQHDNTTSDNIAGVQIGVTLPIWNRNQGGIRRAEAELMAAHAEARQKELELHARLISAYERYRNARQEVQAYRAEILPDAKKTLELVTLGYQQGEMNFLQYLTAERTYFHTNLDYVESLRRWREAMVQLEGQLVGGALGDAAGK